MDPNDALLRYVEAAEAGDVPAMNDAHEALVDWLRRGGFTPESSR